MSSFAPFAGAVRIGDDAVATVAGARDRRPAPGRHDRGDQVASRLDRAQPEGRERRRRRLSPGRPALAAAIARNRYEPSCRRRARRRWALTGRGAALGATIALAGHRGARRLRPVFVLRPPLMDLVLTAIAVEMILAGLKRYFMEAP